ncbi:MAG: hypothetical protein JF615_04775 [Asticcacaulis sp.]|nr:hypothetical protein [Asticcacaulis sp.]
MCDGLSAAQAAHVWESIASAYGEPHRHYHTLDHIAAVIASFDTVRAGFEAPDQALLALFFHDIVYDPARGDNEARSAELVAESLPGVDVARASHHILMTKRHDRDTDPDTNLVLDIDMAILGAPWTDYLAYARNVAREYLPVYGHDAYALFLNPTLERDHIFLKPEFAHLDAPTRRNLMAERDLWQSGGFGAI